jgi:hypothetical protein
MAARWLDVGQAAIELGISSDAVRKRIARGTLPSDERDGQRVVWLDDSGTEAGRQPDEPSELVEALRSQVDDLREQVRAEREANRENRRLLAAALERMPMLEPHEAHEPSDSGSRADAEDSSGGNLPDEPESAAQRPWWRRIFGG